jgi:hypothetical protein
MTNETEYSYLTEEELLRVVSSKGDDAATPLERELALRLTDAIDTLDSVEDALDDVLGVLAAHGLELCPSEVLQ